MEIFLEEDFWVGLLQTDADNKMTSYSCYLVCKENIDEVKEFLKQFFEEIKNKYNYEEWISFKFPDSNFQINLMYGHEEDLTQNMNFEISVDSLKELEKYSKKYKREIKNFLCNEAEQNYKFYYIEIPGPKDICSVDISYCEDIK